MKKEKIKRFSLVIIAVVLIGIGYMNYDYEPTIEVASIENEEKLGDVQLVNAGVSNNENIIQNSENIEDNKNNENEYFVSTRLERENMYSQMIETYQNIINSSEISSEQKSIAINEIDNITKIKNSIMISENLIKNKGFEDVVVLVSNNTASIIVKASNLTQENISQIQNIICRELGFKIENITITSK